MTARLRARLRDDRGVGMSELLVSMMVGAILLAMVGSLFVSIARSTSAGAQTREASGVAANISNELGKVVRFAAQNAVKGQLLLDPAVVAGTSSSVTIYSLVDTSSAKPAPSKVRFSLSNGELLEERWKATDASGFWTFGSGAATSSRKLGGTIVTATAGQNPLFTYLDSSGGTITPSSSGLTLAQRETVRSIRISVRVRPPASPDAKPVLVENVIGMPNLGYGGEDD